MAKDLVSSLGTAELNALTAVHVVKLRDTAKRMEGMFAHDGRIDFSSAYTQQLTPEFEHAYDKCLNELLSITETLDRLRQAQKAASKKAHE